MMKTFLVTLIFTCACGFLQAQVNYITTIAGNGTAGYCCDDSLAIYAELNSPCGICFDARGNIYIADPLNERIRKIDLFTGIITTLTGNGIHGYTGDNIPATDAELFLPVAVLTDTTGNVYIADGDNNRIRKITISTGIITTVAGDGTAGSLGDGGLATNAQLFQPNGICLDKYGNLYIADLSNYKIRKVDAKTGIITTVAGTGTPGYTGDNGPAIHAEFASPGNVYADSSGNIFITDSYNNVVRKITVSTGIITAIAGNGTAGYSGDGGPATNALLNQPYGIYIDKQNNIFITEWGSGTVRRIDGVTGIITTVAGNGTPGFSGDGGPATVAELVPEGICLDDKGIMYIADFTNNRVRMIYNPLGVAALPAPVEIRVYPNPAKDRLTIEHALNNILCIYDLTGREVYKAAITSDKETVDISNLTNGVYIVQMIDADRNRVTRKVVKE
jgi:hypothetical protein